MSGGRRHQEKKKKAMREGNEGGDDGVDGEEREGKGEWGGDEKDVRGLDLEEGV